MKPFVFQTANLLKISSENHQCRNIHHNLPHNILRQIHHLPYVQSAVNFPKLSEDNFYLNRFLYTPANRIVILSTRRSDLSLVHQIRHTLNFFAVQLKRHFSCL